MSFETALRSRLRSDATLTGLLGVDPKTGGPTIYWDERPQASPYPAVVLLDWFGERSQNFAGAATAQRRIVQVSCFAAEVADAVAIRDRIIAILEAPATVDDVEFQGGFVELRNSPPRPSETKTIKQRIADVTLWYS